MKIFPASVLLDISTQLRGSGEPRQQGWLAYLHEGRRAGFPYPFPEVLYRGQVKRFRPFLPSIVRGLHRVSGKVFEMSIQDQAQVVLRLAQSKWFVRELAVHPMAEHAKDENTYLDEMALAQHYEIPTGYLDLTHDFDVAAFFATCQKTSTGWEPAPEGIGVIYRVEISEMHDAFSTFIALGVQPIPRPMEQSAWVVEVSVVHSFDEWPMVKAMEFQHDRAVAQHFLDRFAQGTTLFPPDPLANVAQEILAAGEIPTDLIDEAIESFAQDPFGIKQSDRLSVRQAVADKISLRPYRRLLKREQLVPFLDDFEQRKRRLSEMKLVVRFVR